MKILFQNEILTIIHDQWKDVPFVVYRPTAINMELWPTIYFYHGWSSNKQNQHMRAHILATMGYQVIMPDAIHHGERGELDYEGAGVAEEHMWEIIVQNIEEFGPLHEYALEKFDIAPQRVGISGHSMGGLTAAGVFTHHPQIKTVIALNGSFNWQRLERLTIERGLSAYPELLKESLEVHKAWDPAQHIDKLLGRPIFTIHGELDEVVLPQPDRELVEYLNREHKNGLFVYNEHEDAGHVVTTNMMDDMVLWLGQWL